MKVTVLTPSAPKCSALHSDLLAALSRAASTGIVDESAKGTVKRAADTVADLLAACEKALTMQARETTSGVYYTYEDRIGAMDAIRAAIAKTKEG